MKIKLLLLLLLTYFSISAQTTRKSLFEYATGTWCNTCACGHIEINEHIAPDFPDVIFVAYHTGGTDPFSGFGGNSIISELGFGAIPSAVVDRVSEVTPYINWYNTLADLNNLAPTVNIDISPSYDPDTRVVDIEAVVTPLLDLEYSYNISFILIEDSLVAKQTGSQECPGDENFIHNNVARELLNGVYGEELWPGNEIWTEGESINYSGSFTVDTAFIDTHCRVVAVVYKYLSPMRKAWVQQAEVFSLTDVIVPVELTSFDILLNGNSVIVNWQTATETNNRGFEILRSYNGTDYEKAGFVNGAGTTTELNSYSFSDQATTPGVIYYRLIQHDYDGTATILGTREINVNLPGEYVLAGNYPNPFNPSTKIEFLLPSKTDIKLNIYNTAGELVQEKTYSALPAGKNEITVNAGGLTSGIYIYEIISVHGVLHDKMILVK